MNTTTTTATTGTKRRANTLMAALTLIIASCGNATDSEQITVAQQPSPDWAVEAAEQWLGDNPDVVDQVFHLEARHQSCRVSTDTTVRCVWARTSPVHEHFGWPHDFVTQEFTVEGSALIPRAPVLDSPAADDGQVAAYLDGWLVWLTTWHPELASAVDRDGGIAPDTDVEALRLAYWEYMAFTGSISLDGLPGA